MNEDTWDGVKAAEIKRELGFDMIIIQIFP